MGIQATVTIRAGHLHFQVMARFLDSGSQMPFYYVILNVQVGHLKRKVEVQV